MAAASEGDDDSFWPGYVDALTAMVKVLTLIMMLLGIVVFSLSQGISKVILLKVAEAAQITPREGASIGELADEVIEAIKRRSEPSSSAIVAGPDVIGRGPQADRGAPATPSPPATPAAAPQAAALVATAPPAPSQAPVAPAAPAAAQSAAASAAPVSAPAPSVPLVPPRPVVEATPVPLPAPPADTAPIAPPAVPAPSAPSSSTAARADGTQPSPAGAVPGPQGTAAGPAPDTRTPGPMEEVGRVAPDEPQSPIASPSPTNAATRAAGQEGSATIVSEKPADLSIPVSGATAAQATAVISIRFKDQATRLDEEAKEKFRSSLTETAAFSKARVVEVKGLASIAAGSITDARRIAYQRVLVVRNELVASGVRADTLRLKIEDTLSPQDGTLVRVVAGQ